MTAEQVKYIWENCPKSVEKLIDWFKTQMPKPIGNPQIDIPIQEAFKNADKALNISMQSGTARFLYDFFDENGIYISILDTELNWQYKLTYDITSSYSSKANFNTRPEAENNSFFEAFRSLELKLND